MKAILESSECQFYSASDAGLMHQTYHVHLYRYSDMPGHREMSLSLTNDSQRSDGTSVRIDQWEMK